MRQSVTWPTTSYFTIEELQDMNSKFINITLRVRLTNAIEDGKVAEIGAMSGGKGRPRKVFSLTPITQTVLNKARKNEINLVENVDKLINVINVSSKPAIIPIIPIATPTAAIAG